MRLPRRLGKPVSLLHKWSVRWTWIGRAAAWDSRLAYAEAAKAEATAVKMVEREAARRPAVVAAWRRTLRLETAKWLHLVEHSNKPVMGVEKLVTAAESIECALSGQSAPAEDAEDRKAIEALLDRLKQVRS